jgi:phospholipid/cholesterol/gamma-HCH transport system permease protein
MAQDIYIPTYKKIFEEAGNQVLFMFRFFRNIFRFDFEWNELVRQCYMIGYKSFPLVAITGFIVGFVMTLQAEPTMKEFGAESYIPRMVAVSLIREICPVIIALICAGKMASGIGAELGSMKVTEQVEAMEVSGANPVQYLVVTRILACVFMVPLLTIVAEALGLVGSYGGVNVSGHVSPTLFFSKAFTSIAFGDLLPSFIKTIFFGFAIGFVGCYKGYNSDRGTESVGIAANSAVVNASLWIIVIDGIAVQLTNALGY